jgi:hypothetical protein
MGIFSKNIEFKNFVLKSMVSWRKFPNSVLFYLDVIFFKINTKFHKSSFKRYPKRAFKLVDYINNNFFNSNIYENITIESRLKFLTTSLGKIEYGVDFSWHKFNSQTGIDPEFLFSFNRWYFLIYDQDLVQRLDINEVYILINKWICQNNYDTNSPQWESYSTSERISSLISILNLKLSPNDIRQFIIENKNVKNFLDNSILHLANNLEYFSPNITFNHVINNLKGILTIAIIYENKELVTETSILLLDELNEIIDDDGMIREGSSHYQLIITRWLLELVYLANIFEIKEFDIQIVDITYKALNASRLFLVSNDSGIQNMPLFGDISPDFDPNWLLNYFQTLENKLQVCKWHYGNFVLKNILESSRICKERKDLYTYQSFTRIDKNEWILFIRHQVTSKNFYPNHSHDDYTSFVLYYKGKLFINDPGRLNYLLPPLKDEYCHVNMHNVLSVDNNPIMLSNHLFYLPNWFKNFEFNKEISISNDEFELAFETNSLCRTSIFKNIYHKRIFKITDRKIVVTDILSGKNFPNVSSHLHLSNDLKIENGDNYFSLILNSQDKISLSYYQGFRSTVFETMQSLSYGNELLTNSIRFDKNMENEKFQIELVFNIINN